MNVLLTALVIGVIAVLGLASSEEAIHCIKTNDEIMEAEVPAGRDEWMKDGVDAHNLLRKEHGAPPLTLNPSLCKSAQWNANENANKGTFDHTSEMRGKAGMHCGENLHQYSRDPAPVHLKPAKDTVHEWYKEIEDYDWGTHKSKNGKAVGHFTQVIWKDTREVCMAYAESPDKKTIEVTAHYNPPGNYVGKHNENVLPKSGPGGDNVGSGSFDSRSSTNRTEATAVALQLTPTLFPTFLALLISTPLF